MNTRRLHHSCKRRREVYLKKMSFFAATFVLILCFSIIAGSRLADAHDDSRGAGNGQKYFKSIEIQSGDTLWILHQNILMETISRFVSMSAS